MIAPPARRPLRSVGALLDPEHLGRIGGERVEQVEHASLATVDGLSEVPLERIATSGPGGTSSFVLKRFAYASDWVMRATGDTRGRAVQAWTSGLLDRLPGSIEHAILACAHDGPGWAVLMRDVGRTLVAPGDTAIITSEQEHFLAHMAAMHTTLWEQRQWDRPDLGFCSLRQRYAALTPATARRADIASYAVPRMIASGWDLLEEAVAPGVAAVVRPLLDDPRALCRALTAYPGTVIHGDWKLGNLGRTDGGQDRQTVLLDWAMVGFAPPAVDLAWYLAVNSARLPVSREATIETFTRCLRDTLVDRFEHAWWESQLDLALLGAFVQLGWSKILGALRGDARVRQREQEELHWWSERLLRGASRLER